MLELSGTCFWDFVLSTQLVSAAKKPYEKKCSVWSLLSTLPVMFCFYLLVLFFSVKWHGGLTDYKSVSLFSTYPTVFFFFFFNLEILGNYESAEEISLKTGNYINNSVAAVSQTMSCN